MRLFHAEFVCLTIACQLLITMGIDSIPSFIPGKFRRIGESNAYLSKDGSRNALISSFVKRTTDRTSFTLSRICMNNVDGAGDEIISTLATLDQQWKITGRYSNRPTGGLAGWTKLVLQKDNEGDGKTDNMIEEEKFVYLLEPGATPSSVILFLGGAGLGQFPHIAYSQILSKVSERLNASIIAAPYTVGLDHFDLSKSSCELLRRAVIQCEDLGSYDPNLPKFCLAHSLGSKLFTIALAAGGLGDDIQGVGYLAYNNFGFKDTVGMVKSLSREMQNGDKDSDGSESPFGVPFGGGGQQSAMFEKVFEFAEQAVSMIGLEFSPSPLDTTRMISMKYDEKLQEKTRLFVFDGDDLDSSQDFVQACGKSATSSIDDIGKLTASGLPGSHLAPVFLKLALEDIPIPEEAREVTDGFTGGFRAASFGDEKNMNAAADEICDWIMGKAPSRKPTWRKRKSSPNDIEGGRYLSGEIIEAEVE